jgi:hypothetical protein
MARDKRRAIAAAKKTPPPKSAKPEARSETQRMLLQAEINRCAREKRTLKRADLL